MTMQEYDRMIARLTRIKYSRTDLDVHRGLMDLILDLLEERETLDHELDELFQEEKELEKEYMRLAQDDGQYFADVWK